ncbi:Esterase EstB [Caulifigura coniformis]|uniref:Esterase EstB n=1 Tax=Caulifigura coniformis TaxID=2527983 RepID=A0A517S801_9PLAN|nr:serine hydrolase [Caulifigura coniformis]QDT52227.1 Esterase EstB [Caulifigura coniformis]
MIVASRCAALVLGLLALGAAPSPPQNRWPEFRGPSADGHATGCQLPLEWSEDKNVRWKVEIPGRGWSSPVVWDDQVWVTTGTLDGQTLSAMCFDRETGKVLFDRPIFRVERPSEIEKFNTYASPTPAIEEGRVYLSWGMYGIVCLDTKTFEPVWLRRDLQCEHYRGAGSSPVIIDDMLIEHYDGIDRQFVVALDKRTGETIWLTHRPRHFGTDNYDQKKAYATPIVINVDGQRQLISPTSKGLFAYDPATGEEIWRARYDQFSTPNRPIYEEGLLFIGTGFGKGVFLAMKPGGTGDVTDSNIVWKQARQMPSKPQAIYHEGLIYVVDDAGIVSCMQAADGDTVWQKRVGGNFSASPILCDHRIYLFDDGGKGTVISTGREYNELAKNELSDGCLASPAVAGNSLFVRTRTHLYCLADALAGKPADSASAPRIAAIDDALKPFIESKQVAGIVTLVAHEGKVVHQSSLGDADVEKHRPMGADAMFWIASMTKPQAATAVMILEQEGKLSIDDPVSKYIPSFAQLKHKDGSPVKETLTIKHLLTHTSGLGGFSLPKVGEVEQRLLEQQAELMARAPVNFEPGSKWAYGWSLQVAGRIVEIVSGKPFDDFMAERIFKPLGMQNATFSLNEEQRARLAVTYKMNGKKDGLVPTPNTFVSARTGVKQTPMPSGGLFADVESVRRFYQMLLNGGELDGVRVLKPETVKKMTSVQTGDLKTGFTEGNAWGLGVCLVREPQNVTAALSSGSFGHGGAYGTQVWCDPVKGTLYILLVQRSDMGNSDGSDLRKEFQNAAAKALGQ